MNKQVVVCLAIGFVAVSLNGCGVEEIKQGASNAHASFVASTANLTWGNITGLLPSNISLASVASLPGMPVGHNCTDVSSCQALAQLTATNAILQAQNAAAVHAEAAMAAAQNHGVLNASMAALVAQADAAKEQASVAATYASEAVATAVAQQVEAAEATTTTTTPALLFALTTPAIAIAGAVVTPATAAVALPAITTAAPFATPVSRLYALSGSITKYHARLGMATSAVNYATVTAGIFGMAALAFMLVRIRRSSAFAVPEGEDERLFGREERGEAELE